MMLLNFPLVSQCNQIDLRNLITIVLFLISLAFSARAVHALPGWTMCFVTSAFFLDMPGYCYVMDVFSAFELPPLWSHLNKVLPDHVFPTYLYHHDSGQKNTGIPSGTGYTDIRK